MNKENVQQTELSRVQDEIVVGQDEHFERRWWKFEIASWLVLALLMLVAVLGGLGRGFLVASRASDASGLVQVQYDRIVHFRTPAQITVKLKPQQIQPGTVRLWVNSTVLKQFGLERTVPRPVFQAGVRDGAILVFALAPGEDSMTVRLALQPGAIGLYNIALGIPGGDAMQIRELILP